MAWISERNEIKGGKWVPKKVTGKKSKAGKAAKPVKVAAKSASPVKSKRTGPGPRGGTAENAARWSDYTARKKSGNLKKKGRPAKVVAPVAKKKGRSAKVVAPVAKKKGRSAKKK